MVGGREGVLSDERAVPPADRFDEWVEPHLPILVAVAIREVGGSYADDVVQDALVRAWRRRSTFDPSRGSARAWLLAVLLDRARRHRVRHRPDAVRLVNEPVAVAGSDDRLDVEAAIRALPTRQRQVVTLHYLADLPVAEVATVLSISAGSVKSHLFDARARLRESLS